MRGGLDMGYLHADNGQIVCQEALHILADRPASLADETRNRELSRVTDQTDTETWSIGVSAIRLRS